jgi:glycosyltransferase involved in cell wall biosynthesis/transposase-like protein
MIHGHYGVMNPYSEDLRKKIVEALRRGTANSEAARSFGVSLSSVKRYARMAEEGRPLALKKRPGSRPKMDEGAKRLLESDMEERPAATLPQGPDLPKVVHVAASSWPDSGGIARYVHTLAAARRAGTSTVLTTTNHNRILLECRDGVPIVRLPTRAVVHSAPTGNLPRGFIAWMRQLSSASDIIHAHLPFPALLACAPLLHISTPLVVTYHNEIQGNVHVPRLIRAGHDLLLRCFLARASAVIVATADYARFCPTLAHLQHKVRVVPYGLEADAYAASQQITSRADDLLLFVGRLSYYKGCDVLLRALARVADVRLDIVGEGPERNALQRLANQLGLADRVTWRGHVPDAELSTLYSSVAALVLPSTGPSESFGLVQLEAHACGTPVISSNLPGVRVVNPDGITGLQVRPGDVDDLSRTIRRLLNDQRLRTRLGERAFHHVRQRFSMRQMLDGVEAVYRDIKSQGH